MVYVRQWQEFAEGVNLMHEHGAGKIRYCTRWRHSKGLLVLKVTDDQHCLQFRTRSALFLNRFHVLTQQSMDQMQAKRIPISAPEKQQDDKLPATEVNKSITSTGEPVESGNDIEAGKKAAAKKKKGKKRK